MKKAALTTARRLSQGAFLALFLLLFIQTEGKGADNLGWPVRLWLDFDPLIFVTTLLSAHAAPVAFYFSLITIALTLVLGRVFCGWACPMGTLNNLAGWLGRQRERRPLGWTRAKYYIMFFILGASIFSAQIAGLLDPLSFLIRSLSIGVYPAFSLATANTFDSLYNHAPSGVTALSEPVYGALKETLLPFRQPYPRQGVLMAALLVLVLALNLRERRFWCRNLCPLGALLGLLSRWSILKRSVSEGCDGCGACARACPSGARPDEREGFDPRECYNCLLCDDVCPKNAISFGFGARGAGVDLGRRRVLAGMAGGAVIVPLLRVAPNAKRAEAGLIRPPGALAEPEFLARCVRCGECMKVCLTGGLQPTMLEAGAEGIWTPVLVPRIGYCEFRCTLCGQVCPTGAIEKKSVKEKTEIKIGLAVVDRSRCLPYAHATPCIVCEEVCPTPEKAVWFRRAEVTDRSGRTIEVQQPVVDAKLCIGCGICEALCPVVDKPAIYVTSIGETRSENNQLLI